MLSFKPDPFYNRTNELDALDRAWKRHGKGGQMLLLYGRRRLGKTYLLQRYFAGGISGAEQARPYCYYLAEQTSAATQRLRLAHQLLSSFPSLRTTAEEIAVSWNTLLGYLSLQASARSENEGRYVLILDEFPYLIEQTPELPSIIQAWWDQEGVHVPLFLILCGSQLSAMAALGNENAPLFGRFNAGIHQLGPLPYYEVAAFYAKSPQYGVAQKLIMYGILGGTPRYHALVDPSRPLAEEVVAILMQPRAILENEVRFLLGSEQIRDPAPYNAVLGAIASGETKFGGIQSLIGVERSPLSFYLRTLIDLGWVRREMPFGERSERRALYRIADPFLAFWYRFIAPLASELQFSDPHLVYEERVAPNLSDYMGRYVFEDVCAQWIRRYARGRGLTIRNMGRYWSRDGRTEVDLMAELDTGAFLFGECKWRADSTVHLSDYSSLRAKVEGLPEASWREKPTFMLFSVGGFDPDLTKLAADPINRLFLVPGDDLIPMQTSSAP